VLQVCQDWAVDPISSGSLGGAPAYCRHDHELLVHLVAGRSNWVFVHLHSCGVSESVYVQLGIYSVACRPHRASRSRSGEASVLAALPRAGWQSITRLIAPPAASWAKLVRIESSMMRGGKRTDSRLLFSSVRPCEVFEEISHCWLSVPFPRGWAFGIGCEVLDGSAFIAGWEELGIDSMLRVGISFLPW